jgi:hypothetical protein
MFFTLCESGDYPADLCAAPEECYYIVNEKRCADEYYNVDCAFNYADVNNGEWIYEEQDCD